METSSIFFLTAPQRLTYRMPCVDIPYFQNGVQGVAGSNPAVPILQEVDLHEVNVNAQRDDRWASCL